MPCRSTPQPAQARCAVDRRTPSQFVPGTLGQSTTGRAGGGVCSAAGLHYNEPPFAYGALVLVGGVNRWSVFATITAWQLLLV